MTWLWIETHFVLKKSLRCGLEGKFSYLNPRKTFFREQKRGRLKYCRAVSCPGDMSRSGVVPRLRRQWRPSGGCRFDRRVTWCFSWLIQPRIYMEENWHFSVSWPPSHLGSWHRLHPAPGSSKWGFFFCRNLEAVRKQWLFLQNPEHACFESIWPAVSQPRTMLSECTNAEWATSAFSNNAPTVTHTPQT